MKKLLPFVILISAFLSGSAQTIEFLDTNTYVTGLPSDNIIKSTMLVKNTSSTETLHLYGYREIISEVTGSENLFCWGPLCYPVFIDTSTYTSVIAPGVIDSSFYADYMPKGFSGVTTIKYCFYDSANVSNMKCITVTFDAKLAGIESSSKNDVKVYPNPASETVIVKSFGEFNLNFKIYDILGSKLIDKNLVSNTYNTIDISSLSKGMYIYSVSNSKGQKIKSERLIVTK